MRFSPRALSAVIWLSSSGCQAFGVPMKQSRRTFLSAITTTTTQRSRHQQCIPRGGALYSTTTATTPEAPPMEIFRNDYQPLPYHVEKVSLDISIRPDETTVTCRMQLQPRSDAQGTLVLDGEKEMITLKSIRVNDRELTEGTDYTLDENSLTLLNIPLEGATVETVCTTHPEQNTKLSGLYQSGSMYCTQCEAMGFRRITYYPDRPDNMSIFERVRIEADAKQYPVLLSNGNRVEQGALDEGRHYTVWSDPFPKPSYLFALVAGDLGHVTDTYMTRPGGRTVELNVYSEHTNVHKLQYAMDSLKRSMQWDEDRFQLEYDLDLYNIVAVESFNMGAMENKGLNIFNTAYVLADQATATDRDFENVEGVIGHEYFHNWTGNRVTCRDWFQLTLKEGLTVFRDQEFSGDMNSKPVNRIENVRGLRGRQFNEDAGPMSHPIRPESYISMDNFYTATGEFTNECEEELIANRNSLQFTPRVPKSFACTRPFWVWKASTRV